MPPSFSPAQVFMSVHKLYGHTVARHGRMIFFSNDTGAVTSSLLRYGEWAGREIAFMTFLSGRGTTVLDVGAYIGTHTLAFARMVGPEGRVIAFEPQPASFRLLERNVAFNKLANVELHEAAAGETTSDTAFRPIDPAAASSFGSAVLRDPASGASVHGTPVPHVASIAIDSLGLDRCDLIKIDVEGMEAAVIAGASDTIRRHQPWIFAECNTVEGGLETRRVLASLGYDVRLHVAQAFSPDNLRGEAVDVFEGACEAGLVGLPPGRSGKLDGLAMWPGEMLLRIETADDLVLGMLNKPQYEVEVLRESAAATSGGDRWFSRRREPSEMAQMAQAAAFARTQDALEQAQAMASERATEIDRTSAQLARTQEALDQAQGLAAERTGEVDRVSAQLARTQEALDQAQGLASERAGKVDRVSARLARMQETLEDAQALATDRLGEIGASQQMVEATLRQADLARSLHRREAAEAAAEMDRAVAALRDARAASDDLALACQRAREGVRRAEDETQRARDETWTSRQETQTAREEVLRVRGEAQAAREEAEQALVVACQRAREETRRAEDEAQKARDETRVSRQEIRTSRQETQTAREEVLRVRGEAQAAREEAEQALALARQRALEETRRAEDRDQKARGEARASQQEAQKARGETLTARQEVQEAREEAEQARDEIRHLTDALNDRQADCDRERGRVDALLASTSWRITGPMRTLSRALLRR